MQCPYCGAQTRVVYGRPTRDGNLPAYQRRRFCKRCNERITTAEKPLSVDPDRVQKPESITPV